MNSGSTPLDDLVVTFSMADSWDAAFQRQMAFSGDQVVRQALVRPDLERVLVADSFRSAPILLARRLLGHRCPFPVSPGRHGLVSPVRTRRRDPTAVAALRLSYARYDASLRRAALRLGLDRPVVVTANPFAAAFSAFTWARSVTYYAWDDWTAFPPHERWWPAYEVSYEEIGRSGRAVCAVSQTLLDRLSPSGPSAVMPNGLVAENWETPVSTPTWMSELPRPLMLYCGTIDGRIDLTAVAKASERFPGGTILFVGLVTEQAVGAELRRFPNVRLHDLVAPVEIPAIVGGADVGLVPHRRTQLTESMSPLKMYEFLAGGLPVAATDLEPMRGVDRRVVLSDSPRGFGGAVAAALALGPAPEELRLTFVRQNSWDRRLDLIFDLALSS